MKQKSKLTSQGIKLLTVIIALPFFFALATGGGCTCEGPTISSKEPDAHTAEPHLLDNPLSPDERLHEPQYIEPSPDDSLIESSLDHTKKPDASTSPETPPIPDKLLGSEICTDISQAPDAIYFRSNLRTFNSRHYAILCAGHIYVRPNTERTGKKGPWQKLTGLPKDMAGDVQGISMDDRFMIAHNSKRKLYQVHKVNQKVSDFRWHEYRGTPFGFGGQNYLPNNVIKWDQSVVSPEEDGNYTDPAGNKHKIGDATCAHLIVLKQGGQHISFNDAWLPPDFNYEICGPRRGAFRAVNLSASGSTFFLINRYGDMYTILWDYDISGPNTLLLKFSYENQRGKSNPARQLPPFPWALQPKIKGRITDRISLHKVGKDCIHRTLRVEGLDASGNTGFYEKDILDKQWVFKRTNRKLIGRLLQNKPYDSSGEDLGKVEDIRYARNMKALPTLKDDLGGKAIGDANWAGELIDFNCYCSPVKLRIHLNKTNHIDLILHTTETLRVDPRSGRGLSDKPRPKKGNVEIPLAIIDKLKKLGSKTEAFITKYFAKKRHTWVDIDASTKEVVIKSTSFRWVFSR